MQGEELLCKGLFLVYLMPGWEMDCLEVAEWCVAVRKTMTVQLGEFSDRLGMSAVAEGNSIGNPRFADLTIAYVSSVSGTAIKAGRDCPV